MALKDKLMTLEDFKAVRDVDVASNQTQFTAIKADLGDVNKSVLSVGDKATTPTGDTFIPYEMGNIVYSNGEISYSASTQRVRTPEGYAIHLTPGSIIGLKDYTDAKMWVMWKADGADTWSRKGDWSLSDVTVTVEGDYAILLVNKTAVTQTSANALGSLLYIIKADNYQNELSKELGRDNLVSNNMEFDGYLDNNGNVVVTTQNAVRYSDWIPVTEGKTYVVDFRVKLTNASNWWLSVCFYDSEKTFISPRKAVTSPVLEASGYYHASAKYVIPSGTAYMRITGRTYGDCYTCVYEYVSVISDMQTQLNINRTAERKLRDEAIENAISSISPSVGAGVYSVVYSPVMYDYVCRGINHRGMAGYPENTMIAFKASKTAGFYFVETDVRITSDGEFVLLHDASINRTARNSDGTELASTVNINSITLAQAKTYDFGIYKGSQFAGEEIPSFEEFLTYCKRGCLHPYIEIKFTETTEAIHALVDTVHRYGLKDRSTYIANSVNALAMIAAYDPTARLGPIYGLTPTVANVEEAATLKTGFNDVIFCPRRPNDDVIEACIENRLNMEIWDYDVADSAILARANMVTGFVHMNKHAGKLIYNDANGITE